MSTTKGDVTRRLVQKALMPIVATAASAAAGFVAKKGPAVFEQTVLPKLKQAKDAAPIPQPGRNGSIAPDELDKHVQQRAEARAARRKETAKG